MNKLLGLLLTIATRNACSTLTGMDRTLGSMVEPRFAVGFVFLIGIIAMIDFMRSKRISLMMNHAKEIFDAAVDSVNFHFVLLVGVHHPHIHVCTNAAGRS
jgi:hypothetical protein